MTKPSPTRDQGKFVVRLPLGMRERIADVAKASGRSMNAEIVYRLEASFQLQEVAALQGQLIEAQQQESRTTEQIIKDLALRLNNLLSEVPANEDGPKLTVGELIDRAGKVERNG